LTVEEAMSLAGAGERHPDLKLMEAFMYRHHPQWIRAKELATDGSIGELRTIQSAFSYFNDDGGNIRNQEGIGGGGLMDIGCYCISLSRFIFDAEPERVVGIIENDPEFRVDRLALGLLDFGAHSSNFTCSTQLVPYQRVHIFGTEGRVEIEIPFNAPPDRPCRLWWQRGEEIEEFVFEVCDQYTLQGDLFAQAIQEEGPVPTPIGDAVANMRVIEAMFESAKVGAWVKI
jgi:predicted dehydrogenase